MNVLVEYVVKMTFKKMLMEPFYPEDIASIF